MPDPATDAAGDGGLADALGRARSAASARHEAALAIRDALTLRLQALLDDLAPAIAANPHLRPLIDPAIAPTDPPRLWIDLTGYVVMAPDPRTYRLVQDTPSGHETLGQARDRARMAALVRDYIAHRLIARQRQLAEPVAMGSAHEGYSGAALALAFVAGGALATALILGVGYRSGWLPVTVTF